MSFSEFIYIAELIGSAVFAITGVLAAQGKQLDIFGVVVVAIVTALGGGTLRDITLDAHPVSWIADTTYLWVVVISAVLAFILCRFLRYPRRLLLVLDAMGLALFAVVGAQKATHFGMTPIVVVMMAVLTGCAGGIIRDIITRQIPLMLQRDGELYATCAVLGALFYVVLSGAIEEQVLMLLSMSLIFVVRIAAIFYDLKLPEFVVAGHQLEPRNKDHKED